MLDKINNFLSPFLQFSYVDNWEEKSSTKKKKHNLPQRLTTNRL